MISRDELIDEMEDTDVVHGELSDGCSFDIGASDYWIGGSGKGFMCDYLGNIEYSSKENVVDALFSYIQKNGIEIVDID